jgi:hypothetical protein
MFDIQYYTDYVIKMGSAPMGRALYRIAVGTIGVLLLTAFFTALMTPRGMARLFPLILGFNTALTGFGLIESTREGFRRKRLAAVMAGVAVVLVATVTVNLLFWKMGLWPPGGSDQAGDGWGLMGVDRFWILLPVGVVTSWLGGALAVRYFKLNPDVDPERRP